mmetsp:Transcript_19645/g.50767  ORF Transcript_19645/g.50767 Transcript_19645/m.50767 type:complete len:222 (-) Transcript_19645:86-751(-)
MAAARRLVLLFCVALGGGHHEVLAAAPPAETPAPSINVSSIETSPASLNSSTDALTPKVDIQPVIDEPGANAASEVLITHPLPDIHPMWTPPNDGPLTCSQPDPTPPFCTMVAYASMAANATAADARAKQYVASLQDALATISCDGHGSLWGCADCIDAYTRWACGVTFEPCPPAKRCRQACYDVVRKCPRSIHFECSHMGVVKDPSDPDAVTCTHILPPR